MSNHSTSEHAGQIRHRYRIGQNMVGPDWFMDLMIENAHELTHEQLDADMPRIVAALHNSLSKLQQHVALVEA